MIKLWFQRQLKNTDLGIFSVASWIACVLIGGLALGFGSLIGIKGGANLLLFGSLVTTACVILILSAAYWGKLYGRYINGSLGISFFLFIFIELVTISSWFWHDGDKYIGILFFYVLIYPAYFIYASLSRILCRYIPRRIWLPLVILSVNFVYYIFRVMESA